MADVVGLRDIEKIGYRTLIDLQNVIKELGNDDLAVAKDLAHRGRSRKCGRKQDEEDHQVLHRYFLCCQCVEKRIEASSLPIRNAVCMEG